VQAALHLTRSNLEEARRSMLDLRAATLEGRSLREALVALLEDLTARTGAKTTLAGTGLHCPMPARVEVALYRIAQEALRNAAQHARATVVTLDLHVTPEQAHMVVQDNGRGFDPSQAVLQRFGLVGMHERAKLAGGALTVASRPGAGTRVEVTLPVSL
jgi:two-component system NarL family sensor kinase